MTTAVDVDRWIEKNDKGRQLLKAFDAEGALLIFGECIREEPTLPQAWFGHGVALFALNRNNEALNCFRKALALFPNCPYPESAKKLWISTVAYAIAENLLKLGDYTQGFAELEMRLDKSKLTPGLTQILWNGTTSLAGRSILIETADGLGDIVMFSRYIPLLKTKLGARRVLLHLREGATLQGLIDTVPGLDVAFPTSSGHLAMRWFVGKPVFDFDVWAPLMSLPHFFKTTPTTIPATLPYLHADPAIVASIRASMPADTFKVGIAWECSKPLNPLVPNPTERSMPFETLKAACSMPGVTLFSLEAGPARLSVQKDPGGVIDILGGSLRHDAAIIACMDLVISVDTSIVHVAGALGKRVWTLLPWCEDWRWGTDRDDSPWYPNVMRLFRQDVPGDWTGVMQRVKAALIAEVEKAGNARVRAA